MNNIKHFRGEKVLQLFSYLETLSENSSFIYRLMKCSTDAIIQLKHKRFNWELLIGSLKNGVQFEDPQESMFVEQIGSPVGSFSIFSGVWMFYQHNLTRLLNIAGNYGLSKKTLSSVYFALEVSQIIAERSRLKRYEGGHPEAEELYIPSIETINKEIDRVSFTKKEVDFLLNKYSLLWEEFEQFVFKTSRKELRKDVEHNGYSDRVSLQPFYKSETGYFILHPSGLLHLAYYQCRELLYKTIGKEKLQKIFLDAVFKEMALILKPIIDDPLYKGCGEMNGIKYLLYKIDRDKMTCFFTVLLETHPNLERAKKEIESIIQKNYPKCTNVLYVVISSQIDDNGHPIMMPKNILHFKIDDLAELVGQKAVNLNMMTLYYYAIDKTKFITPPTTQDIDLLAYYLKRKQTFYKEKMPDGIYAEVGLGHYLRNDYYVRNDLRYLYSPYYEKIIPVQHFTDIPKGVPVYGSIKPQDIQFIMTEVGSKKLCIRPSKQGIQQYTLYRELAISISLWTYAVEYKKGIDVLMTDIDIELILDNKYEILQKKGGCYTVSIDITSLNNSMADNPERDLFLYFVQLMKSVCIVSQVLTEGMISAMFEEAGGHFMVTSESDPISLNDGIVSCHYVSDRWVDVILDEIADHLDRKGIEQILSIEESKEVMISVISYLQKEAKEVLKKFDSKHLLSMAIDLHHAMLYWSNITQRRFDNINSAYQYIDAKFENQFEYLNMYAEMNILTQGIIEYIVLNNLNNNNDTSTLEDIDKLFAVMHHITNMGVYLDMLVKAMTDTELTIIENGRIAIPEIAVETTNKYFSVLRKRSMEYSDLLTKQGQFLTSYEFNLSDESFLDAFVKEYGISFEYYQDVLSACINYSADKNIPIVQLSKNEFERDILNGLLSDEKKNSFYDSFVLTSCLNDQNLPPSESFLQRFNRATQITTRPWILYNDTIFFSLKVLAMNVHVFIDRISNGTLHGSTEEMKSFIGHINENKGDHFTKELCRYYQSLNDPVLIFHIEVQINPDKPLAATTNLGDIDLLIINTNLKQIICIEAKVYYEARTTYDFITQSKKIEKEIKKAEKRDLWSKRNIEKFKFYYNNIDEEYEVKSFFVTYNEPTYNYISHKKVSDIPIIPAFDLIKDAYCLFK
ncbi:MAG: hypothetical protein WCR36_06065 [Bacteroidaceae bacterium]